MSLWNEGRTPDVPLDLTFSEAELRSMDDRHRAAQAEEATQGLRFARDRAAFLARALRQAQATLGLNLEPGGGIIASAVHATRTQAPDLYEFLREMEVQ